MQTLNLKQMVKSTTSTAASTCSCGAPSSCGQCGSGSQCSGGGKMPAELKESLRNIYKN